jgi:hypothetical protein
LLRRGKDIGVIPHACIQPEAKALTGGLKGIRKGADIVVPQALGCVLFAGKEGASKKKVLIVRNDK